MHSPSVAFAFAFSFIALALTLACGEPPPAAQSKHTPRPAIDANDDEVIDEPAPPDDEEDPPPEDPIDDPTCEPDVVCIEALPFDADGSTIGGSDRFDTYACGDQDESGPERIYRVTLPSAGSLVVELDDVVEDSLNDDGSEIDIDVHILGALDADACIARGDRRAVVSASDASDVSALTFYVALDSYVFSDGSAGAGAFRASFVFTAAGELGGVAQTLADAGVPADVATLAGRAWENAELQDLSDASVYSVIDFSRPSSERRLWIVDTATGALLVHDRVTHGIGSNSANDASMADAFSNTPGSNQSSLGLARTAETYQGSNGYSLRLDGLEDSNSNMRDRAIVIHGAEYAEDAFVETNGYLGRSNGCPAVAMSRSADIIDIVKEGTLIFSYFPDAEWLESSAFLD